MLQTPCAEPLHTHYDILEPLSNAKAEKLRTQDVGKDKAFSSRVQGAQFAASAGSAPSSLSTAGPTTRAAARQRRSSLPGPSLSSSRPRAAAGSGAQQPVPPFHKLKNLGNTCFLNSLLWLFAAGQIVPAFESVPPGDDEPELWRTLQRTLDELVNTGRGRVKTVTPSDLRTECEAMELAGFLDRGDQQCAAEVVTGLLEAALRQQDESAIATALIRDMWHQQFVTVRCERPGCELRQRLAVEDFASVGLPIEMRDNNTISGMLREAFGSARFVIDYKCNRHPELASTEQFHHFSSLPEALLIVLGRNTNDRNRYARR